MAAKLAHVLNPRRLDRVHRTAVAQAVSMPFVFRESGVLRVLRESVIRILLRQHPEQPFIRSQPSEQRVNRWSFIEQRFVMSDKRLSRLQRAFQSLDGTKPAVKVLRGRHIRLPRITSQIRAASVAWIPGVGVLYVVALD